MGIKAQKKEKKAHAAVGGLIFRKISEVFAGHFIHVEGWVSYGYAQIFRCGAIELNNGLSVGD